MTWAYDYFQSVYQNDAPHDLKNEWKTVRKRLEEIEDGVRDIRDVAGEDHSSVIKSIRDALENALGENEMSDISSSIETALAGLTELESDIAYQNRSLSDIADEIEKAASRTTNVHLPEDLETALDEIEEKTQQDAEVCERYYTALDELTDHLAVIDPLLDDHTVAIPNHKTTKEFWSWFNKTIQGDHSHLEIGKTTIFVIGDPDEATLLKLRWGGNA